MPKKEQYNQEYENILLQENQIKLLEPFKGAKQHHLMECLICNHIWTATPISKRQTLKLNKVSGCPNCNNIKREKEFEIHRQTHLHELSNRGIIILSPNYDGRLRLDYKKKLKDEKILVKNIHCGHEFLVTPLNLIQSTVICGICGPKNRIAPLTRWSKANSAKWKETASEWQQYKSLVGSLTRENYKRFKQTINPQNFPRNKAGINGAYHLDHIVPIRFCFNNKIPAEICADPSNLQMLNWQANVGSRDHIKGTIPSIFFQYIDPTNRIKEQMAFIQQEVFPNSQTFVRIGNSVVNLFDEKTNHAVLIIPIDKTYANMKIASNALEDLQSAGVTYSIIFEDEFSKKDLILCKLRHYTKQNKSTRIHARQCEVRCIDIITKREFLKKNHIQGNDTSTINYGAFYNSHLVAVMTFVSPRFILGQPVDKRKGEGIWELSRFATDITTRIPGIASKLLTYFKNNNEWKEIYSYADRRWSQGNLYETIGFSTKKATCLNYFYVIDGQRKHRGGFQKHRLCTFLPSYDPLKTEYQNMYDAGYHRVWDCGTLKYTMFNI